jgi:peptidoglycan/LPS O-acetylase OafA/YrhL
LGELSYAIYLVHVVLWHYMTAIGLDGRPWACGAVMGASVLLSLAVRHWIEMPVDRWRSKLTRTWLASR